MTSTPIIDAREAERRLKRQAAPARAATLAGFFKTGPGQYGEGDRFLGLTLPQIRALARQCRLLPLEELDSLLQSSWHEARLLALITLTEIYPTADPKTRTAIYRLYLRCTDRINNWDLVDVSAPAIVGAHLLERPRSPLHRLARSKHLWERRMAMVATHQFIRRRQFEDAIQIAAALLGDSHDLIHKAVGWMLREIGKRDEPTLLHFLDRHAALMPRTALRYSIERLSPSQKAAYMAVRPVRRGA